MRLVLAFWLSCFLAVAQQCPQGYTLTGGVCVANGSGGGSGSIASNAEYTTSQTMTLSSCPAWMGTFTGTAALSYTLIAPIAGCTVIVANNTTQPLTIYATTNAVTLNGQLANGTIPACTTPANGCFAARISAVGTTSWDSTTTGAQGPTGATGAQGPAGTGGAGPGALAYSNVSFTIGSATSTLAPTTVLWDTSSGAIFNPAASTTNFYAPTSGHYLAECGINNWAGNASIKLVTWFAVNGSTSQQLGANGSINIDAYSGLTNSLFLSLNAGDYVQCQMYSTGTFTMPAGTSSNPGSFMSLVKIF